MEHIGIIVGIGLLLAVSIAGWLLARKANESVRKFRSENYESFRGRKQP
jgi:hypothetical protein